MRRFFFDVAYWVLVPLLLLNMVSGVILDRLVSQFGRFAREGGRRSRERMCIAHDEGELVRPFFGDRSVRQRVCAAALSCRVSLTATRTVPLFVEGRGLCVPRTFGCACGVCALGKYVGAHCTDACDRRAAADSLGSRGRNSPTCTPFFFCPDVGGVHGLQSEG